MSKNNQVHGCLKLFRGRFDDDLWKKLMRLTVHGEDVMAIEILCEQLEFDAGMLNKSEKKF